MIYMWFTGINYYKLAVEKERDSIFTTITTIYGNQVLSFSISCADVLSSKGEKTNK
jgi:hypothetical protein